MRRGLIVAAAVVAEVVAAGGATAAEAPSERSVWGWVTSRASVGSAEQQANRLSFNMAISSGGRYVAFWSDASNLVPGDTNRVRDVFVRDRLAGVTRRVSIGSAGQQANRGDSDHPAISANGRYVAFTSSATNLVPGDTNTQDDVFIRDRRAKVTRRVSIGPAGQQANRHSSFPEISADGRYVAFFSEASNLVSGDTNSRADVFVRDRVAGVTERVSVGHNGRQGNDNSHIVSSISADGRYVAFTSAATNLVPADTNTDTDVFVRDRQARVTRRVSIGPAGQQANRDSLFPSISANGRYVAFTSAARNLVPADTNTDTDVFVRDRQARVTRRVSIGPAGQQANGRSSIPSISASGRYVAFWSLASNLVPADSNGTFDVFVRDRQSKVTRRASVGPTGRQANDDSHSPAISADGRHVAFASLASNLVPGDTNGTFDVFVRDRLGDAR